MSKLSYYHADVSIKVKISKNRSVFKMAVTFDLNKTLQFCFDILKDDRKIFDINSGVFMHTKILPCIKSYRELLNPPPRPSPDI